MCQQFCDTVSNFYPLTLSLLTILGVILIINFVQGADDKEDTDIDSTVDDIPFSEKVIKDSRYDVKKHSRCNKDVNRWGRWSLIFRDDHKKTVIGMLYNVLENNPQAYKYKEIK